MERSSEPHSAARAFLLVLLVLFWRSFFHSGNNSAAIARSNAEWVSIEARSRQIEEEDRVKMQEDLVREQEETLRLDREEERAEGEEVRAARHHAGT